MSLIERVSGRRASSLTSQQQEIGNLRAENKARVDKFSNGRIWSEEYNMYLTPDGIGEVDTALSDFEDNYNTALEGLADARSILDSNYATATDLEKGWEDYSADFIPVGVYDSNNELEGSYYLPRSVVETLATDSFNQGDGSFIGRWYEDESGYAVSTVPQGGDDAFGAELHTALGEGVVEVKDSWYEASSDSTVADAEYKAAQIELDAARASYDAYKTENTTQLEEAATAQAARMEKRKETVSALSGMQYDPQEDNAAEKAQSQLNKKQGV